VTPAAAEAAVRILGAARGGRMRALLTGWFSFTDGEKTARDVLALEAVGAALRSAAIAYDTAWSPMPARGVRLENARPERYTHLIFVCGPVRGEQVAALHARFASCRRRQRDQPPPTRRPLDLTWSWCATAAHIASGRVRSSVRGHRRPGAPPAPGP
jgi:hypothetical protein